MPHGLPGNGLTERVVTTTEDKLRALIHMDRSRCSICGEKFSAQDKVYEVSAQEVRPPAKRISNTFRVRTHDLCLLEQVAH